MKGKLILVSAMAASIASATIIHNTPAINGTYALDATGNTPSALSGVGIFTNPNTADIGTVARYYTGTISAGYNPASWQAGFKLQLLNSGNANVISIGNQRGDNNWGYWVGTAGNQVDLSQTVAAGDLDYQIKVSNEAWNKGTVEIFFGANATAASEGTADITLNDLVISGISSIAVDINYNSGSGNTATVSNFAVGDEWVAIPEPATMGMIGLFGGGILFIRRIFMV
ncbi:hypothetical protein PDESU_05816 [Pontiella desulfatans]|uniref:PEP-CTERM protein-sorting domain-containing protein n=1 Tax=Pontiella desulfatans TaxID=2750659 RepID=A0A6C2UAX0_PONDE|nr:PEP-CTERM sorting domain-containing protein [Pontiella desulfatans]VGO17220.1 hypothetical protein PDESU_05816 [Pontiella desulfatans]